jgi:hypothetical protein
VQLFPERDDRTGRRLIPIALLLSLLVHLVGVGAWVLFGARVAPVIARLVPRPTPEIVALSDAITIEKRTVPREAHPAPQRRRTRPQPRRVAQLPAPLQPALPTLPPVVVPTRRPTLAPTTEPTYRPEPGQIHHPRAEPTREPTPEVTPREAPAQPPSSKSAYSPQQIAALDAQFSKTIAQAQHSLVVPPQAHRPTTTLKRYQQVMAGSRGDLTSAQGECIATQTWYRGNTVWHYQDCEFVYNDGFSEHVLIPWPQAFARNDDPVDHPYRHYRVQDPPPGWMLPHPFAFSRLICIFYKAECQALVERERANGDPNYAPP